MANLLHRATHRIPGVPAHTERPAGHHGRGADHRSNHAHLRAPRFLPAWQRRIARLFGQAPR
ncbi:hypothetical protein SAMN05421812_102610 [Asanoa hainanensis]|uniref:Uncharacterized protein n=1 Tax=Asanoa hainanensis TaxID=560556 RepID=A0A239IWX2_9ACTN|nr:hypothetical protein SAMN05421812_102610 [Asanoa hainanensis]